MQSLLLWLVTLSAIGLFLWRLGSILKPLKDAQPCNRRDQSALRVGGVLGDIALHRRLLNIGYSGTLHLMIFSSFLVLFTAIIQAFGSGLFPGFSLSPIGGETWIALLQDIFAVIILVGIAMACWQRFIVRPERFEGSNTKDATVIYVLATMIVVTMILEFAFSIARDPILNHPYRPVSSIVAGAFDGMPIESANWWVGTFYWLHILSILAFLVYIPGSKHRHMFLAPFNIYFRPLEPKGQLPAPSQNDSGQYNLVSTYKDLRWKDLLDGLSCTECGRCQAVCPAHAAGQPLSPKKLVMALRDGMITESNLPLAGGLIDEEVVWSCTTCRACMEVCPLHIEHVPKIVQMRRALVEEGKIEPMLQTALGSFQSQGNSFGKPPKQRARWTKGLSFKIADARKTPVDILWFVGDFASFDPRVQSLTVTVGELLNQAGVDFGIMYDGERNSGNDVRRAGDEGLFEMLATHNIETLAECEFNRIMTTDPHSLNAIGSEYRALGANYEILHYTQFLNELVKKGKLEIRPSESLSVTYHDPCYLGRYNDGFDAPRELLTALGHHIHEMGRCRENSFCCGAGGGRIWMDDSSMKERPSENRIREALSLGSVSRFVVACPKDVVMYNAAIQALGVEDELVVSDIAELVSDAVELPQHHNH
jgi:Fe-S oxidoreductase